ncbi:MAG: ABC transporter ATP-binding protein [Candidatus Uhrbacteria bacterium]|nr:ABC transporter ATP-binding protein [Candidatus Uhrbacteria bacterium]
MVMPSVREHWIYIPPLVIFAFIISCLTIAEPFIYGSIIDSVIESVNSSLSGREGLDLITPLLIAWAVIALASTAVNALSTYLSLRLRESMLGTFTTELFRRLLSMDIEVFHREHGGGVLRKFDNAWNAIWRLGSTIVRGFLGSGFLLIIGLIAGFILDWRLTLVVMIPIPFVVGIGLYNLFHTAPSQHKSHKFWEKIFDIVGDYITNIATVKSYFSEAVGVKRYAATYAKAKNNQNSINRQWATSEAGYGGIYIIGRLLVFIVGTYWVLNGTTSLGTLIMFLGFATYISSSVQQMMITLPDFSDSLIKLDRAGKYWFDVPKIQNAQHTKKLKSVVGNIEVKNLSFSYARGNKVLNNLSFNVPAGTTVALVGESGAGKSTLAQMMMRFYDPDNGSISIDGTDMREIDLKSLRKNIGFVMQENLLFHETVLNNIKFAKPRASEREIINAAKRAQAHQFIKNLPDGYNTMVGERGVKLSGGQKQRIALARVLLEDSPILVLDEATSALDSKTERELQTALQEIMKDRTTIVIAHRLSTVLAADNILVMDKGRVVDQGKHEDLIKRGGLYKQYWEIQAGGYI